MQYSNAKKGIGLIFTAAILELIASIFSGLVLVLTKYDGLSVLFLVVFSLVALVMVIVAAIQYIRGIAIASRDEYNFKQAILFVVLDIIFVIIDAILLTFKITIPFANFISSAFECLIVVFICYGISSIFRSTGRDELAKKGISTATIYVIAFLLGKCIQMLVSTGAFSPIDIAVDIIAIIVFIVLDIVAYIKFLVYLNKAKNEV
ncbi:MAG: hypothetical protein KBS62_02455 [Oscillospiraceae bacterium]|nr:hypothetical protein [Candidatus Ruminococcus equi]